MSQSKTKEKRKVRFLRDHPVCCFCGGSKITETWDHVPPKACFPEGHWPETFEFPACFDCNSSTKDADQIFAYHSMLMDYDPRNLSVKDARKLHSGINNNYREALPKLNLSANEARSALRHAGISKPPGMPLKDVPVVLITTAARDSIVTTGRKLGCALYYRETGKIAPGCYGLLISWHQTQNPHMADVTQYLEQALPSFTRATRRTIKEYGNRFCYWSGETEGLFVFATRFGRGLMIWGIVAPKDRLQDYEGWGDVWPIFGSA
ncbi:hypothetical protein [Methylobacterium sp. Leaf99]|uniref:hypothetical protein n=1 Tax=Methylobacterium sp. Leaf99 TaxID=1736251 RepID=UPI000B10DD9E|nr:hypothetical protein [Methylobacterium sp. Leaf99]